PKRVPLTTHKRPFYSAVVEVFARKPAAGTPAMALARVAKSVQPELEEVDRRITEQAKAFDPAIEAYVTHAVGGRGKRLRPLLALLAGGACGPLKPGHVDLAVIVELIHIVTLVHDDIMDEAARRRGQ